jgi:hypothetical protein
MSQIYSATFVAQTVTAATLYELFSLKLATGNSARLIALYLSQNALAQDANDTQITYQIKSGYATQVTTGGTSVTPQAGSREGTSTTVTAYYLTTATSTGGTAVTRHSDAFNDRAGLVFIPTPEQGEALQWGQTGAADVLQVELSTTSTTKTYTTGFNGTIYWAEN